jgi:hypothetical protein
LRTAGRACAWCESPSQLRHGTADMKLTRNL